MNLRSQAHYPAIRASCVQTHYKFGTNKAFANAPRLLCAYLYNGFLTQAVAPIGGGYQYLSCQF
jgi:hypothetical protein